MKKLLYLVAASLAWVECSAQFATAESELRFSLGAAESGVAVSVSRDRLLKTESLLQTTEAEFERLFRVRLEKPVVVELIAPEAFEQQFGARAWTGALYYRGRIIMPLFGKSDRQMQRSLRHEMAHAFVNELSAGRAPAWIDEGLAVYFEGKLAPQLGSALCRWTARDEKALFFEIDDEFQATEIERVSEVYAVSQFAAASLIKRFGMPRVLRYLTQLASEPRDAAFEGSFAMNRARFELELEMEFERVARSCS